MKTVFLRYVYTSLLVVVCMFPSCSKDQGLDAWISYKTDIFRVIVINGDYEMYLIYGYEDGIILTLAAVSIVVRNDEGIITAANCYYDLSDDKVTVNFYSYEDEGGKLYPDAEKIELSQVSQKDYNIIQKILSAWKMEFDKRG